MSFNEVKQLRKNAQLDEAFKMAQSDLENDKSPWAYRALFWVLHDKCKIYFENNQIDQAFPLVEQMKEIFPNMEEEYDSIAEKRLMYFENKLSPLNEFINKAIQESKDDKMVEHAFKEIKKILEDSVEELDAFQQATFGWIIYRYVKHKLEKKATYDVRMAFSYYFKLAKIEKPSILHSLILQKAVELENDFKNDFKFTVFFEMWGFDKFENKDWERFKSENMHLLPSLVEKAIGRYCKEIVDDNITTVPDEFMKLIEKAKTHFHGDGKVELNYARVLAAQGEVEKAVDVYRNVTEKIPQPYVWQEMSKIISDKEIKQAILCKVILMTKEEQFLGDVRLQLAQQLIENGNFAAAKFELETYHHARLSNNWSVKSLYYELLNRIPADVQTTYSNEAFYHSKLDTLNLFMYPDAKTEVMLYGGKPQKDKKGKLKAKLVASDGTSIMVPTKELPHNPSNQPYYFYKVKYAKTGGGNKPLSITAIDSEEGQSHFQVISGSVKIKTKPDGKRFGFVGDCYVHNNMLEKVIEGQELQVIAIKTKDGRLNAAIIL